MRSAIKNHEGFSLIEMIIVISIITMLSVGAAVSFSYRSILSRQESSHLQIMYNIRKIQNYALTGVTDENGKVPFGYGLFVESDTSYVIYRDENADYIFNESNDTVIQRIFLPERIILSPVGVSLISVVPHSFFCYDKDNSVGGEDCSSVVSLNVDISGSTLPKTIFIDQTSGQVSGE